MTDATTLTNDGAGNLKDDGTHLYDYDSENRRIRGRRFRTGAVWVGGREVRGRPARRRTLRADTKDVRRDAGR
jgi:hypothetical protein